MPLARRGSSWRTKDGRVISIKEMVTPHLINVYCMCFSQILESESNCLIPEEIADEIEERGLKDQVEEYWKVYRVMRS